MKNTIKSLLGLAILGSLFSCSEFENEVTDNMVLETGEADFSKYVALGNSLTAGYQDGTVFMTGQKNAYPAIMAHQMGITDFKTPLVQDELGGMLAAGTVLPFSTRLQLQVVNGSLFPVPTAGMPTTDVITGAIGAQGPYQNLGVSGAKVSHLLAPGYGNSAGILTGTANPYFVYFASSAQTSVLQDAVSQNPTFFSLWIGNNDVLGYATSGGVDNNDITAPEAFNQYYTALVDGLTANGAKGVVANIPAVTSVPFFTTIPYNALTPEVLGEDTINTLNGATGYGGYNAALDGLAALGVITQEMADARKIMFSEDGPTGVVIKDEDLPNLSTALNQAFQQGGLDALTAGVLSQLYGQIRHAKADDLILLTAGVGQNNTVALANGIPEILAVNGVTYPLQDAQVLTGTEVQLVVDATNEYNNTIEGLAESKGLALADMAAVNESLQSGLVYNGTNYTSQFITGGSFSLDGVHLNQRGYAVAANTFIQAINTKYGSTIPTVDPNTYEGVIFP